MKTNRALFARAFALALPLCAVGGVAVAQEPPPPPPPASDAPPPPPPPTYVATVDPVYYNGQPTYWYQNHWYWRDGSGNWQFYRDEPGFLRDHRMHGPPARHFEERRNERRR